MRVREKHDFFLVLFLNWLPVISEQIDKETELLQMS